MKASYLMLNASMNLFPRPIYLRDGDRAARRVLPFLLLVFIVLVGCVTASASVVALARTATPSPSPFAAYADVFPGQIRRAVAARGFSCLERYDGGYSPNLDCTLNPVAGDFSQVSLVIEDGVIDEISFGLRDDTFRVGDLMLLWGAPVVHEFSRSVYLHWRSQGVFALVRGYSEFSLYLPIPRISFVNSEALLVFQ
jgi:hypothetical protein